MFELISATVADTQLFTFKVIYNFEFTDALLNERSREYQAAVLQFVATVSE